MARHLHRCVKALSRFTPLTYTPTKFTCLYKLHTVENLCNFISTQCNGFRFQHSDVQNAKTVVDDSRKKFSRRNTQEELIHAVVFRGEHLSPTEWNELKAKVLNEAGSINEQSIDGFIMGICASNKQWNTGLSFYDMLCMSGNKPNLATLGNFLRLCYVCNEKHKDVLTICQDILEMYPVLDLTTSENVMYGLALTDEWRRGFDILSTVQLTSQPSPTAYNTLVRAAFDHGEHKDGWDLVEKMLLADCYPSPDVYLAWLKQCYKASEGASGVMIGQMLDFWESNDLRPCTSVVEELRNWFEKECYSWEGNFTELTPMGSCKNCHTKLKSRQISDEDFSRLRSSFFERVMVGSNVYLKTNPEELETFREFLNHSAPFDVVIDGLNVAFSTGRTSPSVSAQVLESVVQQFVVRNQKVLVLGRRHMDKWPSACMSYVREHASIFLTHNISQDDPFLLYAAMHSGPRTKFLSRDLMRSHLFLLREPALRRIFIRWQQQQQLRLLPRGPGKVAVRPPLLRNTSVQQGPGSLWHIPYDLTFNPRPQLNSEPPRYWLCLRKLR